MQKEFVNYCITIRYIRSKQTGEKKWLFLSHIYTQWGQTAVYSASAYGHSEMVQLLVQAGADLELHTEVYTYTVGDIHASSCCV